MKKKRLKEKERERKFNANEHEKVGKMEKEWKRVLQSKCIISTCLKVVEKKVGNYTWKWRDSKVNWKFIYTRFTLSNKFICKMELYILLW